MNARYFSWAVPLAMVTALLCQACRSAAIDTSGRRTKLDEPYVASRDLGDGRMMIYRPTPSDVARLILELRLRNVTDGDLLDPQGWLASPCTTKFGRCSGSCRITGNTCSDEAFAVEGFNVDGSLGAVRTCRCRSK